MRNDIEEAILCLVACGRMKAAVNRRSPDAGAPAWRPHDARSVWTAVALAPLLKGTGETALSKP
jgi:hypothetical protein